MKYFAVLLLSLFVLLPPIAEARQQSVSLPGPPMRMAIFRSGISNCLPSCAVWISLEGVIDEQTPALFRKALKQIGVHTPQVLISSGGGVVEAAMEIGRLIRARGLNVAVARSESDAAETEGPASKKKPDIAVVSYGRAVLQDAYCASACTLVLAAGKARYVAPGVRVGLHEMLVPEQDVTQHVRYYQTRTLTRGGRVVSRQVRVVGEKDFVRHISRHKSPVAHYRMVARYLSDMGLPSAKIVELMRSAAPEDISWLTRADLESTRLMTAATDPAELLGLAPKIAAAPAPPPREPPDALTSFAYGLGMTVGQLAFLAALVLVMGVAILRSFRRIAWMGVASERRDPPPAIGARDVTPSAPADSA